ncbi:hypothetical protein [Pseudophaeobacter leonis]|uniref:hypothetical protein n=1 Tax=Pseudophaeobacter leonis TaxID=1144477 RepID=UPI0009F70FFE|nr:hypothetical protein [Pseudophaeobacter leonis]
MTLNFVVPAMRAIVTALALLAFPMAVIAQQTCGGQAYKAPEPSGAWHLDAKEACLDAMPLG